MAEQGFNDWRLVSMTPLAAPWLGVLGLALLAALVLSALALRRAGRTTRATLLVLRLAAALLLATLILEPGVELLATARERGRLVLLLDASASMALADGDRSRWERAQAAVRELTPALERLGERYVLEIYRFADAATPAAGTAAAIAAAPEGQRTDLVAALEAVAPQEGRRPLGGVLMISDGADNRTLADAPADRARPVVEALGAPIHALAIGEPARFRDLSIDAVLADDFAFVRNRVEIEAVVSAYGLEARRIPLSLREGGQVVAMAQLEVDPARPTQRVSFGFTPVKTGKKTFVIEAPLLEGEAIVENNRRAFTLKVIRDRIRVLQVAGRPSWDERFLRVLLKANPSVDLISFFILRTQTDIVGRNDELSLIPFPTEDLFTKELKTFDVVIFQNFNYRPYHMGLYLSNVRDFVVEQGGGFAMIGGDLSYSEAGYATTPLAEILPVQISPSPRQYRRAPFRPVGTEAGRGHPILELERGELEPILGRLPALEGFNLSTGVAPDAHVLLEHPYERIGGRPMPVVAVREVGRGRVLSVLSDDTWFWGLPDAGVGGRGTAHRRFWANALRWLIRDPALSRVRVETGRQVYDPGAEIEVRTRAYDVGYRPQADAAVELRIVREDGADEIEVERREGQTDADGELMLRLPPHPAGNYRVRARATSAAGVALGTDEEVLVVRGAAPELTRARPRPELLEALARMSGGSLLQSPGDVDELDLPEAHRVRVHRAKRVPLWDNAWTLLLIAAVLASEWWLRRRWGFS